MSEKLQGFVRWYDVKGDDGIITDFEGNEYYFNSYSFPKSHYVVSGKDKITKRPLTVRTRNYPGMFLQHTWTKDHWCLTIKSRDPVEFEQASGIEQRWAVNLTSRPDLVSDVLQYRYLCALDCTFYGEFDGVWNRYNTKRLDSLINEILSKGLK